jgi:hypothetical protein
MVELWTAIGLAVSDLDFNEDLQEIAKVRGKKEALKKLLKVLQEYEFRFSAYELVEFLRIIKTPEALKKMVELHNIIWFRNTVCLWAWSESGLSPDFQLPYLVFDNKRRENVMATVDPLTSEPTSDEILTESDARKKSSSEPAPKGKRRFERAK